MSLVPRKILVVDDDPAMRRILTKVLTASGYDVSLAADGREALDQIRGECPHFVITDWDMPALNGVELCQELRRNDLPYYVYVIMLTGSNRNLLVEGLSCGADDFITKPIDMRELLARLQSGSRIVDLESKLRLLARCDPLTEVLNRRTFFEIAEKEWNRSLRSGADLSCLIMDVDHFKAINDTYGHQPGDQVLRAVAQVVQGQSRIPDSVCRYGGEEFCMLLPDTDESGASRCAERCRQAIADLRFDEQLQNLRVNASFGAAQRDEHSANPAQLVNLADQALLMSKRTGRNRVTAFSALAEFERALSMT
ncbi:MAG: diguanylate cyclase [Planctomycetia bacterium]|nr:diguanylate cyclase [Planctomycetia bacterium]